MKAKPIISIIIPVYNGSNYLREAIDSALAQTDTRYEVIVVNDGSTDDGKTEAVAKSYGNKIRYLWKKNGRVASALNYGIRHMNGDWFAWLSHDDIFLPYKVSEEIRAIKKNPGIRAFYGNTAVVNVEGEIISNNNPSLPKKVSGGAWYFKTWIYGCSFIVHKSCFRDFGYFNEKNRTAQDVEMILALLSKYEFIHIPKILSKRRDHEASDFHTLHELNVIEGDQLLLDLLKKNSISFFYPFLKKSSNVIEFSDSYNELGWLLIQGNPKISQYCYEKSRELNSSIFNLATIFTFIGISRIGQILNLYFFIRNSFHGLWWRIINVFHFWV